MWSTLAAFLQIRYCLVNHNAHSRDFFLQCASFPYLKPPEISAVQTYQLYASCYFVYWISLTMTWNFCSHAILIYLSCAFPGVADHWWEPPLLSRKLWLVLSFIVLLGPYLPHHLAYFWFQLKLPVMFQSMAYNSSLIIFIVQGILLMFLRELRSIQCWIGITWIYVMEQVRWFSSPFPFLFSISPTSLLHVQCVYSSLSDLKNSACYWRKSIIYQSSTMTYILFCWKQ